MSYAERHWQNQMRIAQLTPRQLANESHAAYMRQAYQWRDMAKEAPSDDIQQSFEAKARALEEEARRTRTSRWIDVFESGQHRLAIWRAFRYDQPVSVAAVRRYKIEVPKKYIRRGRLFIHKY